MARSFLVVGAHVVVYVNGKPFGRVAEMSVRPMTPHRAVKTVDVLYASELVPTGNEIMGDMKIFRLHKDGGLETAGMAATWADQTRAKYFSILVRDRVTDTVLFRSDRNVVLGQSWHFGRGYVMGDVQFQGLVWDNETQPAGA